MSKNIYGTDTCGLGSADRQSSVRGFESSRPSQIHSGNPELLASGNPRNLGTNGDGNRTRTGTAHDNEAGLSASLWRTIWPAIVIAAALGSLAGWFAPEILGVSLDCPTPVVIGDALRFAGCVP